MRTRLARRADGGEGRKEGRGRQDEDDIPESALFAFPDEELRPGPKEPIVAAAQTEVVVLLVDAIERSPPVFMTVKWRWRTRSEPPCCRLGGGGLLRMREQRKMTRPQGYGRRLNTVVEEKKDEWEL